MYHTRHKGTHYEAGYKWGNLLFHNGNIIANQPTFSIIKERNEFSKACLPIYQNIILKSLKKLGESQMVKEGLLKIYLPFYQACIVLSLQITVLVLRLKIETTLY